MTSNTKLFMDMSVKIVQIALKKENRKEMTAEFAELVRPTYTAELFIKKKDCYMCPHNSRSILILCVVILAYPAIMRSNTNIPLRTYIHTYISIKKKIYTYIRTYIYVYVSIYMKGGAITRLRQNCKNADEVPV